jgi:hypothetical protein
MKRNLLICVGLMLQSSIVWAEFPRYPSHTIFHATNGEKNGIYAICEPHSQSTKRINCRFIQMSVVLKTNPSDFDKELLDAIKSFDVMKHEDLLTEIRSLCHRDSEPENAKSDWVNHLKKIDEMPEGEAKQFSRTVIDLINKSCDVETYKNAKTLAIELVTKTLKWETVSCKIWPNVWEESFEYKIDQLNAPYWLAQSSPQGACGVINISTFKDDYSNYLFDYETKRIVTNKEGGIPGIGDCSDTDERTVKYSWTAATIPLACKQVTFGLTP